MYISRMASGRGSLTLRVSKLALWKTASPRSGRILVVLLFIVIAIVEVFFLNFLTVHLYGTYVCYPWENVGKTQNPLLVEQFLEILILNDVRESSGVIMNSCKKYALLHKKIYVYIILYSPISVYILFCTLPT